MVGLKRRPRVEGWALDTSDSEDVTKTTLQRLGDNNRLWVITLVAVLVVSAIVMHQARDTGSSKQRNLYKPPAAPRTGAYADSEHRSFAAAFARDTARGAVLDARFTDDRTFRLIVAGDVSADDIEYDSWMAAQRALKKFGHRVVVKTYQRSAAAGGDILRATTDWSVSKHGFIVRFAEKAK